jgi:hypothetical protein
MKGRTVATGSLEDRVAALEAEVARLKMKVEREERQSDQPWWKQIWGIFADDPDFEEAMRLGREYRDSLRPKPPGGRKKR